MSLSIESKTIGVLKTPNDPRVCLLPKEVKALLNELPLSILIETGLGDTLNIRDKEYNDAGGRCLTRESILTNADIIVSLGHTEIPLDVRAGLIFIGIFNPLYYPDKLSVYREKHATLYSLDLIPRTTLAQSMDVLSSMASLAGYKAILTAAELYNNVFPMFTTAAGTLSPVKVLVLGAGVAGLQAIATAKRLGAVVEAFDVRSSAAEEVRSLGASFIEVEGYRESSGAGGYAVEQSETYLKKQKDLIHDHILTSNIVISTANIPGKKAPLLIETRSVEAMQPSSVIIDMAVEQGGNCELSKNEEIVYHNEVIILGNSRFSTKVALSASKLLSHNYFSFLKYLVVSQKIDDPILSACQILKKGEWVHAHFTEELQPI